MRLLDPLNPETSARAGLAHPGLETPMTSRLSCPGWSLRSGRATLTAQAELLDLRVRPPSLDNFGFQGRLFLNRQLILRQPRLESLSLSLLLGDNGLDCSKKIYSLRSSQLRAPADPIQSLDRRPAWGTQTSVPSTLPCQSLAWALAERSWGLWSGESATVQDLLLAQKSEKKKKPSLEDSPLSRPPRLKLEPPPRGLRLMCDLRLPRFACFLKRKLCLLGSL